MVGPGSGLAGAVWWVLERKVRMGKVCYSQVVRVLGAGWGEIDG